MHWFIAGLVALVCVLTPIENWVRAHARDVPDYWEPPPQWCAWGRIVVSEHVEQKIGRRHYFFVRFPSYQWAHRVWSDTYGWHQCVLFYSTGRGWSLQHWPV